MAYVIGSEKGKNIAENLKSKQTYIASDGSKWKKESDGSVTVTTKSGETFKNAYTPSSSSAGSSNKNSQYTSGGNYSPSTQTVIAPETNPSIVDIYSADKWGLSTPDSGNSGGNSQYSNYQYQIGSDLGKSIADNLAIGATYNNPYDGSVWVKNMDGSITVDYNGHTTQNAYQMSDLQKLGIQQNNWNSQNANQQWDDDWTEENPQPTAPEQDPRINTLLNEILNRDDFSYDVESDPLYQQYAKMYQREGDRAMRETLAEAAAGAGGMNTYAITAAQQANNYYNSQLNDKIPELYQLAYEMYLNDKESKVQDLGILQSLDDSQYNRYRDTMKDYYADRNFAYGMYQDAVDQSNWQTNFNYNSMINDRNFNSSEYWANKEYEQIEIDNAIARVEWAIANATMPSAEDIQKSGLPEEGIKAAVERAQEALATNVPVINASKAYRADVTLPESPKVTTGSDKNTEKLITETETTTDENLKKYTVSTTSPLSLGIGLVDDTTLKTLVAARGVLMDENGNYSWANGWNSKNYKEKLAELDPITSYFGSSLATMSKYF